ncbi:MAG TPA: glucose-6-phosphate dehydrogenase [Bryobacteraceae bacterium]|jgi:glucose-6-phosphate 1-dehydrogenase|nr:glucose-6-phosphate dehydrogenase [Bryobacteraceae bacterium]
MTTQVPPKSREYMEEQGRPGDPCTMVIFGVTGDLTKRKLIPSLYNLAKKKLLPMEFALVGVAINDIAQDKFLDQLRQDLREFGAAPEQCSFCDWLLERTVYLAGDFRDAGTYRKLKAILDDLEQKHATRGNYFYYLATAPSMFGEVIKQLGEAGLAEQEEGRNWRRVVIEKPFGRDLESARALNIEIRKYLKENQIYRIDHYLGKETVQNILAFRFSNGIFEPVWNRRYIDHVQISVAETLGVEQRGGYYDHAGALRDMVPNHILQLVTLTSMEPPISFGADAVRDEQVKILHAIQPLAPEDVLTRSVRGQYGPGVLDGDRLPGYRTENQVAHDSSTETYVALKLSIDNWRWADVPFYIRTGKRLPKRVTEVAIQFRRAPFVLFRDTPVERLSNNLLVLHIQPDEGISLTFGAKIPGPLVRLGAVNMEFRYQDYFGTEQSTGYERLLYDCMLGDATLFQRADMVEAGWSVIQPVIDVWRALPARNFPNYPAGTWGPKEADDLMARDNRAWRLLD